MNSAPTLPVRPRPSATVVLVRDARDGPEVLLVRRHAKSAFGATYVFPGGLLEAADREVTAHCTAADATRAADCLGPGDDALAYYSAAIRELFEETGVLLARDGDGGWALQAATAARFARARRRLNDGAAGWREVLAEFGLALACDRLHYVAHWITPQRSQKRFTTRFFVAALPGRQDASHDGAELTDSCWLRASAALDADADGRLELPPPTRATLRQFAGEQSVAGVLAWADACQRAGVEACLPAVIGSGAGQRVVMPGDPDYPPQGDAGS